MESVGKHAANYVLVCLQPGRIFRQEPCQFLGKYPSGRILIATTLAIQRSIPSQNRGYGMGLSEMRPGAVERLLLQQTCLLVLPKLEKDGRQVTLRGKGGGMIGAGELD